MIHREDANKGVPEMNKILVKVKVGQIIIWPIWGCSQFSHNSQELFDTDFFFLDGTSGTVRTGFRS